MVAEWTDKDERQYEHIVNMSILRSSRKKAVKRPIKLKKLRLAPSISNVVRKTAPPEKLLREQAILIAPWSHGQNRSCIIVPVS